MAALIERLLRKDREQAPATAKKWPPNWRRSSANRRRRRSRPSEPRGVSEPVVSSTCSRLRLRTVHLGGGRCCCWAVLAATVIIRIKTPNGETKEMRFPDGTTVEVVKEKDASFVPKGAGPLDRLDPAKVPAAERFADMPKEVVAVLGENRGGHNLAVGSVAVSPDGKLAASISNQDLRLWDVATMCAAGGCCR